MRHIRIYALLIIATLCACGGKPELESVSATSTLADAHNRYKAANLIDGTASNWCEGSQGSGIGTEIRLRALPLIPSKRHPRGKAVR